MADSENQSQRNKKTASKQNKGHPSGKNTPAGAARKLAIAEKSKTKRKDQKPGPKS